MGRADYFHRIPGARETLDIVYLDSSGGTSQRRIDVFALGIRTGEDGEPELTQLRARCHLRKAPRAFQISRITQAVDPRTGEVLVSFKAWFLANAEDKLAEAQMREALLLLAPAPEPWKPTIRPLPDTPPTQVPRRPFALDGPIVAPLPDDGAEAQAAWRDPWIRPLLGWLGALLLGCMVLGLILLVREAPGRITAAAPVALPPPPDLVADGYWIGVGAGCAEPARGVAAMNAVLRIATAMPEEARRLATSETDAGFRSGHTTRSEWICERGVAALNQAWAGLMAAR